MVVAFIVDKENVDLLVEVGFTRTQAKLYLTLLGIGRTDAKTLAKQANIPRQAAYRILDELQEKGLVEKIIGIRHEFKVTSLEGGLSSLVKHRVAAYAKTAEKVTEFLQKYQAPQEKDPSEEKYHISILEGKDVIIKKTKKFIENSHDTICVCQTLQRWLQSMNELAESIEGALQNGIKYQVVLEKTDGEILVPKEFMPLFAYKNLELHTCCNLRINAALFDGNVGCFCFYPDKALSESPVIVTNHPSLLIGFQDHFNKLWYESKKGTIKYKS